MNHLPEAAAGRQTHRYEKKREAILDAATNLFNAKGIRGTTLADVAGSVGLITASVTYYYRKKEDLASACFLRTIAHFERLIAHSLAEPEAALRLRRLIDGVMETRSAIAHGAHPPLISFGDIRALGSPQVEAVFAAYTDMFRRLRGLFQGPGAPLLPRQAQNARTHLLLSLVHTVRFWLERFDVADYGRGGRRMSDILIGGLAADGAPWPPAPLPALPRAAAAEVSPEAFLLAATRLINEQGYRGASVEKISSLLQVTKGSFYHHNDNKDDLVAACFERTFAAIRRVQDAAEAAGRSGFEQLAMATDALVRFQLSEDGPLLRHTAFSALPEAMRIDVRRRMDQVTERFAYAIVDGMIDGSVRPLDPAVAAQLVHATINAAAELERWVPGVDRTCASELYARPLLFGILSGVGGS